jgi:hypothetical protein
LADCHLCSRFLPFLLQIVWDKRFRGWNGENICLVSIDCTDCPIQEPWPFDRANYSVKLNGPALKYELAISIKSYDIVHVNGPFAASESDTTIFRERLMGLLCKDECVECDSGAKGELQLKHPKVAQSRVDKQMKYTVRACHEIVNGELKLFNCLNACFRHHPSKHESCFKAITVIVQLGHGHGKVLFPVEYNVDYS